MKRIILITLLSTPLFVFAQSTQSKKSFPKENTSKVAALKKDKASNNNHIAKSKAVFAKAVDEVAVQQGHKALVKDTTKIYTARSIAENTGFSKTVAFDGVWETQLDLDKMELTINGGILHNMSDKPSNKLRIMVYYADKEFDLKKPDLIGTVFSSIDVEPLAANEKNENQTYITKVVLDTAPAAGTYYPYILLGELNTETEQFEVKDVKVFKNFVTLP